MTHRPFPASCGLKDRSPMGVVEGVYYCPGCGGPVETLEGTGYRCKRTGVSFYVE